MAGKIEASGPEGRLLEEALERGDQEADPDEVAAADARLDELLEKVAESKADPKIEPAPKALAGRLPSVTLCTGFALSVSAGSVRVVVGGEELDVVLGAGVSRELVKRSIKTRDRVLLEQTTAEAVPRLVGVVQSTIPEELILKARKIHIEADHEVLLRSGRGAMRIREDGDVELVGSRISAMSRGLFRLVGRVLRLN